MADEQKHGRRPPHKELKLQKSSPAPGERKHRPAMKQFTGSSSVVEDIDNDSQAGSGDRGESDVVSGKELAVLQNAEQLMYQRTLFVNAFPDVMTLNTWVREVWEEAEDVLGEAEQSLKSRKEVNNPKCLLQSELNRLNSFCDTIPEFDRISSPTSGGNLPFSSV